MVAAPEIERVATSVVDSCVQVHKALGPGLLGSAYQACLAYELTDRGFAVALEVPLPLSYRDVRVPVGYRIDMVIEDLIVVENKTVQALAPVHYAQLLTYLRLAGKALGFLVNWHVPRIREGIKRMVNRL